VLQKHLQKYLKKKLKAIIYQIFGKLDEFWLKKHLKHPSMLV